LKVYFWSVASENPRVGSSILPLATNKQAALRDEGRFLFQLGVELRMRVTFLPDIEYKISIWQEQLNQSQRKKNG
jgi:hypothetical protein